MLIGLRKTTVAARLRVRNSADELLRMILFKQL
jgi:hypothetical protein